MFVSIGNVETGQKTIFRGSRKNKGMKTHNLRHHFDENAGGHRKAVLSISCSSDGKFVASGGADSVIRIWDPRSGTSEALSGHRGPVTAVAFREGSYDLYSGSEDKTVKVWNVERMAYVETL